MFEAIWRSLSSVVAPAVGDYCHDTFYPNRFTADGDAELTSGNDVCFYNVTVENWTITEPKWPFNPVVSRADTAWYPLPSHGQDCPVIVDGPLDVVCLSSNDQNASLLGFDAG